MAGDLESIVALQKTLVDLTLAQRRLDGVPEWMQELHEEHRRQRSEIDAMAARIEEAAQARRAAEAALTDAQQKQKHYQEQISLVSTQREYGALLKEIDTVKAQVAALEQQTIEALEQSEAARGGLQELEQAFAELDERYQRELEKWNQEKPAVAQRVAELDALAGQLRERVPRGMLALFERIYGRYEGDAVARVVKVDSPRSANVMLHCAACSYNVRPQILVEIRTEGRLNQCDGCKRILYWQEGSDAETAQDNGAADSA